MKERREEAIWGGNIAASWAPASTGLTNTPAARNILAAGGNVAGPPRVSASVLTAALRRTVGDG